MNEGHAQLQADGFSSRSGWLTSAMFGGGSWLAHATLESGTWVNSPGRYSDADRQQPLTLAGAFRRAGWRTVADVPATEGAWPEGRSFYRYQKIYDRDNLGYHGPKFGFSPMPDQYALRALQQARAGEAAPPSDLRRDRHDVEPRAMDAHPTADLLEPARQRLDLQPPAHRPGRPERRPAGLREVDPVLAACAVLVRRALRQQEHRAASRWATTSPRESSSRRVTTCRSRSSPTTRR